MGEDFVYDLQGYILCFLIIFWVYSPKRGIFKAFSPYFNVIFPLFSFLFLNHNFYFCHSPPPLYHSILHYISLITYEENIFSSFSPVSLTNYLVIKDCLGLLPSEGEKVGLFWEDAEEELERYAREAARLRDGPDILKTVVNIFVPLKKMFSSIYHNSKLEQLQLSYWQ